MGAQGEAASRWSAPSTRRDTGAFDLALEQNGEQRSLPEEPWPRGCCGAFGTVEHFFRPTSLEHSHQPNRRHGRAASRLVDGFGGRGALLQPVTPGAGTADCCGTFDGGSPRECSSASRRSCGGERRGLPKSRAIVDPAANDSRREGRSTLRGERRAREDELVLPSSTACAKRRGGDCLARIERARAGA